MFFTLNRIEDKSIAVLIDDNGKKYDINASLLPAHDGIGSVFSVQDDVYVFEKGETDTRRARINEKSKAFFNKLKNKGRSPSP